MRTPCNQATDTTQEITDTSWFAGMGLEGYVGKAGRGRVRSISCAGPSVGGNAGCVSIAEMIAAR